MSTDQPPACRSGLDDFALALAPLLHSRLRLRARFRLPPSQVTGRKWCGTAFGGFKSRTDVPILVEEYMSGDLPLAQYVTHRYQGVGAIKEAIDAMHKGDVLRAVVSY